MGAGEKAKHASQSITGKAEEKLGQATTDPSLEAEGKVDQAAGDVKQAREKMKDAAR
ncbi:MAG: CsbD family protein [Acidimicrobiales bacterium]